MSSDDWTVAPAHWLIEAGISLQGFESGLTESSGQPAQTVRFVKAPPSFSIVVIGATETDTDTFVADAGSAITLNISGPCHAICDVAIFPQDSLILTGCSRFFSSASGQATSTVLLVSPGLLSLRIVDQETGAVQDTALRFESPNSISNP
jgi:homoaconitase/3-isopropylmalate dehydratase large subunit